MRLMKVQAPDKCIPRNGATPAQLFIRSGSSDRYSDEAAQAVEHFCQGPWAGSEDPLPPDTAITGYCFIED